MRRWVTSCKNCPFKVREGSLPPRCDAPEPAEERSVWPYIIKNTMSPTCPLRVKNVLVTLAPGAE